MVHSKALSASVANKMSSTTWLEAMIAVYRRGGDAALSELEQLREDAEIELLPFTEGHAQAGIQAHQRFGKGRHPAQLNFGDCIAYATAEIAGEALLFKGDDFARTDVRSALAPQAPSKSAARRKRAR